VPAAIACAGAVGHAFQGAQCSKVGLHRLLSQKSHAILFQRARNIASASRHYH